MGVPVWLYHKKYKARIFDSDDVERAKEHGWMEAPDPKDLRPDKLKKQWPGFPETEK